jgi:hypothetical protein
MQHTRTIQHSHNNTQRTENTGRTYIDIVTILDDVSILYNVIKTFHYNQQEHKQKEPPIAPSSARTFIFIVIIVVFCSPSPPPPLPHARIFPNGWWAYGMGIIIIPRAIAGRGTRDQSQGTHADEHSDFPEDEYARQGSMLTSEVGAKV